tara:strand:- start:744 stop:1112 length:369 start_codon:yes stop_codon:yes gene_type:complete
MAEVVDAYHETCTVVDDAPLAAAAQLLAIDVEAFRHCITFRSMQIRGAGNAVEDIGLSADKAALSCHRTVKAAVLVRQYLATTGSSGCLRRLEAALRTRKKGPGASDRAERPWLCGQRPPPS